jgi:hypothetical protein
MNTGNDTSYAYLHANSSNNNSNITSFPDKVNGIWMGWNTLLIPPDWRQRDWNVEQVDKHLNIKETFGNISNLHYIVLHNSNLIQFSQKDKNVDSNSAQILHRYKYNNGIIDIYKKDQYITIPELTAKYNNSTLLESIDNTPNPSKIDTLLPKLDDEKHLRINNLLEVIKTKYNLQ